MVTVKGSNGVAVEVNVALRRSEETEMLTLGVSGSKTMAEVALMDESLAA